MLEQEVPASLDLVPEDFGYKSQVDHRNGLLLLEALRDLGS